MVKEPETGECREGLRVLHWQERGGGFCTKGAESERERNVQKIQNEANGRPEEPVQEEKKNKKRRERSLF